MKFEPTLICDCGGLEDIPLKAPGRSRKLLKGTLISIGCECKLGKKKFQVGTVHINNSAIDPTAPLQNFE